MKLFLSVAAVLAATTAAQNTSSTTPTPAPTTPCPVIPGWEKPTPAPTPAATTPRPVIPGWEKCTEVSVERDATYCIDGPVCSGADAAPAGTKCPKKGDVAKKDCLATLTSYADAGKCVAPVDAQCVKIKTGAWGCVFTIAPAPTQAPAPVVSSSSVPATPASTTPCPVIPGWEKPTPAPTPVPTTPCPVIPGWEKPTPGPSTGTPVQQSPAPTTTAPVQQSPAPTAAAPVQQTPVPTTAVPVKVALAASSSETTEPSSSATNPGLIAAGAAGVVAVLALVGAVVYKKHQTAEPLGDGSSPTIYNGAVNTPV